ncbi:MAG: 50S ribosomal protein L18 [Pirellulales bacterium]|nr:50S ribosomal protein L18 [Pirellulales bacterium]
MKREKAINKQRERRGFRVRNRVRRDSIRPRLSVFRSHKHLYAQVIDDLEGRTLAAASTVDKEIREKVAYGGNMQAAQLVGETLAKRALEAGVKQVAFDRREYKYHGRVAALADAARDAGLDLGAKEVVIAEKEPKKKAGAKKEKGAAKKGSDSAKKEKGGGAKKEKKK